MKLIDEKRDKIIRIIIGVVIIGSGWYYQSWWGLLGIVPLIAAFMGCCPFGKESSTSDEKEEDNKKSTSNE